VANLFRILRTVLTFIRIGQVLQKTWQEHPGLLFSWTQCTNIAVSHGVDFLNRLGATYYKCDG